MHSHPSPDQHFLYFSILIAPLMISKFVETADFLRNHGIDNPETGIVLGTGLGKLVDRIDIVRELDYEDIPHFPLSTVEYHKGKLIYGFIKQRSVLAMQGRFHYYEGYSLAEVTYPIRIMKMLGMPKDKVFYFVTIDEVKFRRPVMPGDTLRYELVAERVKGKLCRMRGQAFVGDELATEALLTSVIMDK